MAQSAHHHLAGRTCYPLCRSAYKLSCLVCGRDVLRGWSCALSALPLRWLRLHASVPQDMAELGKVLQNPGCPVWFGLICALHTPGLQTHWVPSSRGGQVWMVWPPLYCCVLSKMAEETCGSHQNRWMAATGAIDWCLSASEDVYQVQADANAVFVQQPSAAASCCWLFGAWLTLAL